jgi:hypothetical protein
VSRKIVQVIRLDGEGGHIPDRIIALFDDGTIWDGVSKREAYDDNRLRSFTWKKVQIPKMPEDNAER